MSDKRANRLKRHRRVRRKIAGSDSRPRLAVFRSSRHTYAQVIDDSSGSTLAQASTLEDALRNSSQGPKDRAKEVGKLIADRAKEKGVEAVVFDRSGYLFHGRIKALADGAREQGLRF